MTHETQTLIRWGNSAKEHIRIDGDNIVVEFDVGGPLIIGPIADSTERRAVWSDVQWILSKAMEHGSEIAPERWKRQEAVVQAGERIVALSRAAMAHGEFVVQSSTLDLCLDAYDDAVRGFRARTVYERLRDPDPFSGEPTSPPKEPEDRQESLPEPETEDLYQVYYMWKARYDEAHEALETLKRKYHKDTPTPSYDINAPCPADLARAYKRIFKIKPVLTHLWEAISAQVDPHLGHLEEPTEPMDPNAPTSMLVGITWLTTILNPRPSGTPAPSTQRANVPQALRDAVGVSEWAPVPVPEPAEGVRSPWDGEPPAVT